MFILTVLLDSGIPGPSAGSVEDKETPLFHGVHPFLNCVGVFFRSPLAGPLSAIDRAPDSSVRGLGSIPGLATYFRSPSAFSRRAVVSYWQKYVHEVLVNRLGGLSLPRKSVVRLTDRPDMTLDVYRGRKTTMQQQQIDRPS